MAELNPRARTRETLDALIMEARLDMARPNTHPRVQKILAEYIAAMQKTRQNYEEEYHVRQS